jgi:hypothetical protein
VSEIIIKLKKLHPKQEEILQTAKRFNVLKCGRRFGKTTLIEELSSIVLDGKLVGIFFPTYKDCSDVWTVLKTLYLPLIKKSNEQLKTIHLITGGCLELWSLEDPDSGRGRKYHRIIVDEAEKIGKLKDAWEGTLRATLMDFKGDAWIMSTPKFGNTYFKTTLFKNEETMDSWKSWRYTSFDNPFLDPSEIEEARLIGDLIFRCEYLAEDVNAINNPFVWAFDSSKHLVDKLEPDPNKYLYLSFDFNIDPICCMIFQSDGLGHMDILETIKLANSNIYELCKRILALYPSYIFLITGDASGKNGSAMVADNMNYYRIIQLELNVAPGAIRIPNANPRLEDNGVLVNALFANGNIHIDKRKNEGLIYDLINVGLNADGSIKKGDRNDPKQQADALDAYRYAANTFHKNFVKMRV